jgi:hypothetical protein
VEGETEDGVGVEVDADIVSLGADQACRDEVCESVVL